MGEKKKTRDFILVEDGVELFFEYIDNNRGDTIVFINGLFQCIFNWYPLIDQLDNKSNLLFYDLRGQGKSKIQDQTISLDKHVLDLFHLMNHLRLEKISIVGMSLGSIIGSMFAINYEERVNKLALLGICGGARMQMILDDWKNTLELLGDFALFKFIIPWIFSSTFIEQNQDKVDSIIDALIERNKLENLLKLIDSILPYPDVKGLISAINRPYKIIVGDEDALASKKWIQEILSLSPLCNRVIFIPGKGHSLIEEAPEEVAKVITDFI